MAALVPLAFLIPYAGALTWAWLSFMNPHRETFGLAFDFHVVLLVALATLAGWALTRRPALVLAERTTMIMLAFLAWTALTTATAFDPGHSFPYLIQTGKTFIMAIALLALLNNKVRIHALILVIAVSLGYYAVKGFGFTLLTGGQFRVLGPDGTSIGDNNDLGLAFAMSLPLLNYLRTTSRHVLVSMIVTFVIVATIVAIIGTYSRGGLVGLLVVASALWFRSRHKIVLTVALATVLVALPSVMPKSWYERMTTIQTYQEDESFEGRVEAWTVSTRIALARPLVGGGFKAIEIGPVFKRFNPGGDVQWGKAAHSIYFQVLGEHGFIGIGLYLAMIVAGFLNLGDVRRLSRSRDDLLWIRDLAAMMQVTFIGVLTAGALLSMAYYDVFITLIALSAAMRLLVRSVVMADDSAEVPSWRRLLPETRLLAAPKPASFLNASRRSRSEPSV